MGIYEVAQRKARQVGGVSPSFFGRAGWLADNRRAIYIDDDGRPAVVDVDSERHRVLEPALPFRLAPETLVMSPDGRTLYAGDLIVDSDIWMLEMETPATAR
jgi:hypothetical protein